MRNRTLWHRAATVVALLASGVYGCGGSDTTPTAVADEPGRAPPASGADTIPPTLLAFDFAPKDVDVLSRDGEVAISVRVEDDRSEVEEVGVQFRDPIRVKFDLFVGLLRTVDGAGATVWEGTLVVPRTAQGGRWGVVFVEARDAAGNQAMLDDGTLRSRGFPVDLDVRAAR